MKQQFKNQLLSSFYLYLDHQFLKKGEAYENVSTLFYPQNSAFGGIYTYAAPYKQIVNDESITGANYLSGVYIGNSFSTYGQNNLTGINHTQGQIYFDANKTGVISGNYAIKDFNILMAQQNEETLLFETKFEPRPKVHQTLTGLKDSDYSYPAIFIKYNNGSAEDFCFGGTDKIISEIRCTVLADNVYNLDAACSILEDLRKTDFAVMDTSSLPFNSFGAITNLNYNYTGQVATGDSRSFIWDISVSKINFADPEIRLKNPEISAAFIDFEIYSFRNPRL